VRRRHHPLRLPHETMFTYRLTVTASGGKIPRLSFGGLGESTFHYLNISTPGRTNDRAELAFDWKTHAVYADANEYEVIRAEWEKVLLFTSPEIQVQGKSSHSP
jgi:hypothetical protein